VKRVSEFEARLTEQQALYADTVSRVEHQRVVDLGESLQAEMRARIEAEAKLTKQQAEHERVVAELSAVRAQMSTLAKEDAAVISTERARAEEAERLLKLKKDHGRECPEGKDFDECAACLLSLYFPVLDKLEAANARAGRLEELVKRGPCLNCGACFGDHPLKPHPILGWLRPCAGGKSDYFEAEPGGDAGSAALSAAPQASTEQAAPSPAVGAYECNCPAPYPEAVHDLTCPEHLKRFPEDRPAQPAPGGTEQCLRGPVTHKGTRVRVNLPSSENHGAQGHVAAHDPKTPEYEWRVEFDERIRNDGDVWFRTEHLDPTDPTPAEPQGRPEQADRPVMLSELAEALFRCEHRCTTVPEFAHYLMAQLERKAGK